MKDESKRSGWTHKYINKVIPDKRKKLREGPDLLFSRYPTCLGCDEFIEWCTCGDDKIELNK